MAEIRVRVQTAAFDPAREAAPLASLPGVGAVVTFTGICRDEGGRLAALELEHYPGMAEAEIERIAKEAAARWPLAGVTVVHRHGKIPVGETIVVAAAASSHRDAAFEGARYIMDFLKTNAPFWKKEHLAMVSDARGDWVSATAKDDAAAQKWSRRG